MDFSFGGEDDDDDELILMIYEREIREDGRINSFFLSFILKSILSLK